MTLLLDPSFAKCAIIILLISYLLFVVNTILIIGICILL
jgi:hypothetical protein